jgi:two-component system cell cycle sensor histidine kinase/response regulator CckA
MDLIMPGEMSGKELAGQLLKLNPKLKVIYVSGYSAEIANREFPLEEGVNFLSKPFPAAKLAKIVREKLDEKN